MKFSDKKNLPKGVSIYDFNGKTSIKLYDTYIFKIDHETMQITLNSGGWNTKHTKKCINMSFDSCHVNAHLFQKKGEWFVSFRDKIVPFTDSMILDAA